MIPVALKSPEWVATPAALSRLVATLQTEPQVGVDTESNSLYAYTEQVCLIQLSTPTCDYLVDPLALHDLSPLGAIFDDPAIEKIFHAAEYDIICLKRDFGFKFENLFDTMLAARILGNQLLGLGSILADLYAVKQDKKYQRANWALRPLPQDQQNYAQLDTHYLISLREHYYTELVNASRWPLACEDFSRLRLVEAAPAENHTNGNCWKVIGQADLDHRQISLMQAVCAYREEVARRENLPPFKVLNNDVMVHLVQRFPQTREELARVSGISARFFNRYGDGLLEALRAGQHAEPVQRVYPPRPDGNFLLRLDALKNWRKNTGRQMGVESDVILPRDVLESIAHKNPRTPQDLAPLLEELPWRREKFGAEILSVIQTCR